MMQAGGMQMTTVSAHIDSPLGRLQVVAGPLGVRAVLWPGDDPRRVRRALRDGAPGAVRMAAPMSGGTRATGAADHLAQAQAELAEYFQSRRRVFEVALDPRGTDFQLSAWAILTSIPFGARISYSEQARRLGNPRRSRAVGAANGANPISIIVPCHRVVAASGSLGGFAGGLAAKQWLLAHESGC